METFKQYTIRGLQVQVSLRLDKEAEGYPTGRYIILLGWRKATSFLRARTHTGIYFEEKKLINNRESEHGFIRHG